MKFDFIQPPKRVTAVMVLSIVSLLATYHETLFSMVSIWIRSETFAHCFLIFPISAYLVWRRRMVLAGMVPHADHRPLIIIALLGLGWLMANLAGVKVAEQFCMVAMIPLLVWAVLGWEMVCEIAFPLFFLLFSVPFGEFLLPRLINFTADFTVAMLTLTGLPVYREGAYFSIPSGEWSVIEACSGLRYLIASITLGCLFAYFNFTSILRRILFITLAAIVPIIANGLRAYMIVMIGHLSGMTLAVGVDHFIYGWFFFGIVMTLLFWIGSFWSEEATPEPADKLDTSFAGNWREGHIVATAVFALMISAIWPIRAAYIDKLAARQTAPVNLALPEPNPPWHRAEAMTNWEPRYIGADAQKKAFYTDGRHTVVVFLKYYRSQEQDKELVNSQNLLLPEKSAVWKMLGESPSSINLTGSKEKILQGRLRSTQQELLTWRWYWISGKYTVNDYLAKVFLASDKLLGRVADEAAIILATDIQGDMPEARAGLQNFVDVMLPSIGQTLADTAKRGIR